MARILIIEDEEDLRKLIAIYLEGAGYETLEAPTGGAGLRMLAQPDTQVDLVVTDVFMPEKDGLEVIMACHRAGMPVVAMSGGDARGSLDILKPAKLLGACEVLRKPFSRDELLTTVVSVLSRPGAS